MSASQAIFQKGLYEITRQDLELFFSEPQEENSILEFKEGDTDLVKLHKEIVAFLNTEGGLLIYGAPREIEHNTKKGYKIASGRLTPCLVKDRDVIMRSLGTGIAPAPTTVKIHEILIDDGSVYILEIGQSMHPPHMVSGQGVYYIRLEREAKPAPHGLVEALFFKRQRADLKLKLKVESIGAVTDDPDIVLNCEFSNDSPITAEGWGYILQFSGITRAFNYEDNNLLIIESEMAKTAKYHNDSIIVKGLNMSFKLKVKSSSSTFIFHATIYAKGLEAITYYYLIQDNGTIKDHFISHSDDSDIVWQELVRAYCQLLKHDFNVIFDAGDFLSFPPNENNAELFNYYSRQNINLEPTFAIFFNCMNGFSGKINNIKCSFFSSERLCNLKEDQFDISSVDNYRITIGNIEDKELQLHRNGKIVEYRLIEKDGRQYVTGHRPLARSFIRLLQKIKQSSNLYMLWNSQLNDQLFP